MAEIVVIVVNYSTADLAIAAVESVLQRSHFGRTLEVHVLDNASPGGDAAIIGRAASVRKWGGAVHLYSEKKNHGFGGGNNVVLRALSERAKPPRYVFFLNPDAQLANEAIGHLAEFLDTHPDVAFAGPQARLFDRATLRVTAFRFPGLMSVFSDALESRRVSSALERWQVALEPDGRMRQVDWVTGAGCLARFSTLETLQFFDPEFFLYYEEVDLMHRAAQEGWSCWYVPRAEIYHMEGASSAVASHDPVRRRKPGYWYASWRHYFHKTNGRAYALLAAALWTTGALINRVIARLRREEPAMPLGFHSDFWAVAIRPLVGLPARPYEHLDVRAPGKIETQTDRSR